MVRRPASLVAAVFLSLDFVENLTGVLAEVGLEEIGGFWDRDADVVEVFDVEADVGALAVEDVAAAGVVGGDEVEVPAGDVDGAGVGGGPEADEGAADALERELSLMGGHVD